MIRNFKSCPRVIVIWENIALKHYLITFLVYHWLKFFKTLNKTSCLNNSDISKYNALWLNGQKTQFQTPLLQMSCPLTAISKIFFHKTSASNFTFLFTTVAFTHRIYIYYAHLDTSFQPPVITSGVKWIYPSKGCCETWGSNEIKHLWNVKHLKSSQ